MRDRFWWLLHIVGGLFGRIGSKTIKMLPFLLPALFHTQYAVAIDWYIMTRNGVISQYVFYDTGESIEYISLALGKKSSGLMTDQTNYFLTSNNIDFIYRFPLGEQERLILLKNIGRESLSENFRLGICNGTKGLHDCSDYVMTTEYSLLIDNFIKLILNGYGILSECHLKLPFNYEKTAANIASYLLGVNLVEFMEEALESLSEGKDSKVFSRSPEQMASYHVVLLGIPIAFAFIPLNASLYIIVKNDSIEIISYEEIISLIKKTQEERSWYAVKFPTVTKRREIELLKELEKLTVSQYFDRHLPKNMPVNQLSRREAVMEHWFKCPPGQLTRRKAVMEHWFKYPPDQLSPPSRDTSYIN